MKITHLRLYKADGEYIEFIVGEEHLDVGVCKSIHNQGNKIFLIAFERDEVTVSGFPYVLRRRDK